MHLFSVLNYKGKRFFFNSQAKIMHSLVVLGAVPTPHFTHVELNLFVTGKARPGQS